MEEIPTKDNYGIKYSPWVEETLLVIESANINNIEELAIILEQTASWIDHESFFIHPIILKKILDKYNK